MVMEKIKHVTEFISRGPFIYKTSSTSKNIKLRLDTLFCIVNSVIKRAAFSLKTFYHAKKEIQSLCKYF